MNKNAQDSRDFGAGAENIHRHKRYSVPANPKVIMMSQAPRTPLMDVQNFRSQSKARKSTGTMKRSNDEDQVAIVSRSRNIPFMKKQSVKESDSTLNVESNFIKRVDENIPSEIDKVAVTDTMKPSMDSSSVLNIHQDLSTPQMTTSVVHNEHSSNYTSSDVIFDLVDESWRKDLPAFMNNQATTEEDTQALFKSLREQVNSTEEPSGEDVATLPGSEIDLESLLSDAVQEEWSFLTKLMDKNLKIHSPMHGQVDIVAGVKSPRAADNLVPIGEKEVADMISSPLESSERSLSDCGCAHDLDRSLSFSSDHFITERNVEGASDDESNTGKISPLECYAFNLDGNPNEDSEDKFAFQKLSLSTLGGLPDVSLDVEGSIFKEVVHGESLSLNSSKQLETLNEVSSLPSAEEDDVASKILQTECTSWENTPYLKSSVADDVVANTRARDQLTSPLGGSIMNTGLSDYSNSSLDLLKIDDEELIDCFDSTKDMSRFIDELLDEGPIKDDLDELSQCVEQFTVDNDEGSLLRECNLSHVEPLCHDKSDNIVKITQVESSLACEGNEILVDMNQVTDSERFPISTTVVSNVRDTGRDFYSLRVSNVLDTLRQAFSQKWDDSPKDEIPTVCGLSQIISADVKCTSSLITSPSYGDVSGGHWEMVHHDSLQDMPGGVSVFNESVVKSDETASIHRNVLCQEEEEQSRIRHEEEKTPRQCYGDEDYIASQVTLADTTMSSEGMTPLPNECEGEQSVSSSGENNDCHQTRLSLMQDEIKTLVSQMLEKKQAFDQLVSHVKTNRNGNDVCPKECLKVIDQSGIEALDTVFKEGLSSGSQSQALILNNHLQKDLEVSDPVEVEPKVWVESRQEESERWLVDELEIQLEESWRNVDDLEAQLAEKLHENLALKGSVKEVEDKCAALEKNRLTLELNLARELEYLKSECIKKLVDEQEDWHWSADDMNEEFDRITEEVEKTVVKQSQMKNMLDRMAATTKKSLTSNGRLVQDLHQLYIETNEAEKAFKEEIKDLRTKLSTVTEDFDKAAVEKVLLEKQMEEYAQQFQQSLMRLEEECCVGQEELKDARFLLEHFKDKNQTLIQEVTDLRQVKVEWEAGQGSIKELQETVFFLNAERESDVLEYNGKLEAAMERNTAFEDQVESLSKVNEEYQRSQDVLQLEIGGLREQVSILFWSLEHLDDGAQSLVDRLQEISSNASNKAVPKQSAATKSSSSSQLPVNHSTTSSLVSQILSQVEDKDRNRSMDVCNVGQYLAMSAVKQSNVEYDASCAKRNNGSFFSQTQTKSCARKTPSSKVPSSRKALRFSSPRDDDDDDVCRATSVGDRVLPNPGQECDLGLDVSVSVPGFAHIRSIPLSGGNSESEQVPTSKSDDFNVLEVCEHWVKAVQQKYSLIAELANLTERSYKIRMKELNMECEDNREKLRQKRNQLEKAQSDLEVKRHQLRDSHDQVEELSDRVSRMTQAILLHEDKSYDFKRLEEDNAELKEEVSKLEGEKDMLNQQVQNLITKVGANGDHAASLRKISSLEKKNFELHRFMLQEQGKSKEKGDKAIRWIKVQETNLKKAEEEICKFDELVEAVRNTCIDNRTMHSHPALTHIIRMIDGLVDVDSKPKPRRKSAAVTPSQTKRQSSAAATSSQYQAASKTKEFPV